MWDESVGCPDGVVEKRRGKGRDLKIKRETKKSKGKCYLCSVFLK